MDFLRNIFGLGEVSLKEKVKQKLFPGVYDHDSDTQRVCDVFTPLDESELEYIANIYDIDVNTSREKMCEKLGTILQDCKKGKNTYCKKSVWMKERDKIITRNDYKKLIKEINDSQEYGGVTSETSELGKIAYNKISDKLFKKAKKWDDVVELFAMYVKGELPGVPSYQVPLTKDVIDFLKKDNLLTKIITKYKIISVDSQPGDCNISEEGYQRSYYDFVINTNMYGNIEELYKIINKYDVFYINGPDDNFPRDFKNISGNEYLKINDYNDVLIGGEDVPITLMDEDGRIQWVSARTIGKSKDKDGLRIKRYNHLKFNTITMTFISKEFCDKSLLSTIDKIFEEYWNFE